LKNFLSNQKSSQLLVRNIFTVAFVLADIYATIPYSKTYQLFQNLVFKKAIMKHDKTCVKFTTFLIQTKHKKWNINNTTTRRSIL